MESENSSNASRGLSAAADIHCYNYDSLFLSRRMFIRRNKDKIRIAKRQANKRTKSENEHAHTLRPKAAHSDHDDMNITLTLNALIIARKYYLFKALFMTCIPTTIN